MKTIPSLEYVANNLMVDFMGELFNDITKARMVEYLQQYMDDAYTLEPIFNYDTYTVSVNIQFKTDADYMWWVLNR